MSETRSPASLRFPTRFDRWYRALSRALFISPSDSYVAIGGGYVTVRMAWGFEGSFPCSAVTAAAPWGQRPVSRGVHGWHGRWLVNGSGEGILRIDLSPGQRARVLGVPVGLRELLASVDDPAQLASALGRASAETGGGRDHPRPRGGDLPERDVNGPDPRGGAHDSQSF